jgi:hypothetical protein
MCSWHGGRTGSGNARGSSANWGGRSRGSPASLASRSRRSARGFATCRAAARSHPGRLRMPPLRRLPVWTTQRVRRCGRCRMALPDVCFNRSGAGRQHWCRTCFRSYFRDRGQVHLDQAASAKRRRRERARTLLLEHLAAHPCTDRGVVDVVVLECDHVGARNHTVATLVADGAPLELIRRFLFIFAQLVDRGCADCGTRDLVVLEFDHVGVKQAMVTRMASHGLALATIAREIAECEVVCANCHRRRTTTRGRHHRLARGTAWWRDRTVVARAKPVRRSVHFLPRVASSIGRAADFNTKRSASTGNRWLVGSCLLGSP